jgi:hypothetical protein
MGSARTFLLAAFAACLAIAGSVAAGCDSSGTIVDTDAGDAAADAGGTDVVAAVDGPSLLDASPVETGGGDADDAGITNDAGSVAFIEFSELPVGGGTFTAVFYATPLGPPAGCATTTLDGGPCTVTTCLGHAANDGGPVTLASAGTLDVTGGACGDAGVPLGPDNLGSYVYNTTGPMFGPADMLGVSASGGVVPGFPAQSLAAPPAISVTAPLAGDAGTLVIPTSEDLDVTWTGGLTGDRVLFTLNALFASGASASTACSWPAAAGHGAVPASALTPLVEGVAQSGGSTVVWAQRAETTFSAGRWVVTMQADIHGGSLATFQ